MKIVTKIILTLVGVGLFYSANLLNSLELNQNYHSKIKSYFHKADQLNTLNTTSNNADLKTILEGDLQEIRESINDKEIEMKRVGKIESIIQITSFIYLIDLYLLRKVKPNQQLKK